MKLQFAKLRFSKKELFILIAVTLMSLLANLPEGYASGLISRKMLLASLLGVVVIAMFRYLQVLVLLVITILAIGANLPRDLAEDIGVSQTALIVSLGFLIAITLLNRAFKLLPTHAEQLETPDAGGDMADMDAASARHGMLLAIARGDIAMIRALLDMGIGVNFFLNGTTPLHMATEKGYSNIVQLLIDHGADPLAKNAEGKMPLDIALAVKKFARTTEILYDATMPRIASTHE